MRHLCAPIFFAVSATKRGSSPCHIGKAEIQVNSKKYPRFDTSSNCSSVALIMEIIGCVKMNFFNPISFAHFAKATPSSADKCPVAIATFVSLAIYKIELTSSVIFPSLPKILKFLFGGGCLYADSICLL